MASAPGHGSEDGSEHVFEGRERHSIASMLARVYDEKETIDHVLDWAGFERHRRLRVSNFDTSEQFWQATLSEVEQGFPSRENYLRLLTLAFHMLSDDPTFLNHCRRLGVPYDPRPALKTGSAPRPYGLIAPGSTTGAESSSYADEPADEPAAPVGPTALLRRVEDAARDWAYRGTAIAIRAESGLIVADSSGRRALIGAVGGEPTEADIDAFLARVRAFGASPDQPGRTLDLVYDADQPARSDLVATTRRRGVELRSLIEFSGYLDLRGYLPRQTAELHRDDEYHEDLYVGQRMVELENPDPDTRTHRDARGRILDWLTSGAGTFILVLADFGHGKTMLMRQLARRLPALLPPHVFPLRVDLRLVPPADSETSLDELVAAYLRTRNVERVSVEAVGRSLREGRLVLLLDGFDELAARVSYATAEDNLRRILAAFAGAARVVLTSRTQYFRRDDDVLTALGSQVQELRQGRRVVRLLGFDDDQKGEFLTRRHRWRRSGPGTAQATIDLLRRINGLTDLAANPRMLSFIIDHLEIADLATVAEHSPDRRITRAILYRTLIERWLRYETVRDQQSGVIRISAASNLSLEQRQQTVNLLARRAWRSATKQVGIDELDGAARAVVTRLANAGEPGDNGGAAHRVGSTTLLRRDDEGDLFSFIHESVMDYLIAAEAADRLGAFDPDDRGTPAGTATALLATALLSPLMLDFLDELLGTGPPEGRGRAAGWMRQTLADGRHDLEARTNAVVLAIRGHVKLDDGATLAGVDLGGRDLTRVNLRGADLSGAGLRDADLTGNDLSGSKLADADLTGARLAGAVLRGSVLDRTSLVRADLQRASLAGCVLRRVFLTEADLAGADFSRARLLDGDLSQARLSRSVWTDAVVLCSGIDLTPDGPGEVFGPAAAVAGRDPIDRMLAPVSAPASAAAFSPDGRWLAIGQVSRVLLADPDAGRVIRVLTDHRGPIRAVAFSPAGPRTLLATASDDTTARIWNATTGRGTAVLEGHTAGVRTVAFSPDGRLLATGSTDATARIWDPATGRAIWVLTAGAAVLGVAFSSDSTLLAAASEDGNVRRWKVADGAAVPTARGHRGRKQAVSAAAASPDGRLLATASAGGTVRIHSTATTAVETTIKIGRRSVLAMAFSPDGQILATDSDDGRVHRWDVSTRKPTTALTPASATVTVQGLAVSPDGSLTATAADDGTVLLWRRETDGFHQVPLARRPGVTTVAVSRDARHIATASEDGTVRLWEPATGRSVTRRDGQAVAFSLDGSRFATAGRNGSAQLWEDTGRTIASIRGAGSVIRSLAFSPDGTSLALGSDQLWTWRRSDNRPRRLEGHENRVRSVAFSPDGAVLASASDDRTVRLWDHADGTLTRTLEAASPVLSVAFSPDGTRLAIGTADRKVALWDRHTGRLTATFPDHDGGVWTVAFAPRKPLLATGSDDQTIRIWDLETGRTVRILTGHTDPVRSVAFTPDGATLVSGSADGTARLWDPVTGQCRATLLGLDGDGWAVLLPGQGGFKLEGAAADAFWWAIGAVRVDPEDFGPRGRNEPASAAHVPLRRLPAHVPLRSG